jgi:hypothetical protein
MAMAIAWIQLFISLVIPSLAINIQKAIQRLGGVFVVRGQAKLFDYQIFNWIQRTWVLPINSCLNRYYIFFLLKSLRFETFIYIKKKERRRGDTVIHNYTRVGFHKNCLFLCFKIFLNIYIYIHTLYTL